MSVGHSTYAQLFLFFWRGCGKFDITQPSRPHIDMAAQTKTESDTTAAVLWAPLGNKMLFGVGEAAAILNRSRSWMYGELASARVESVRLRPGARRSIPRREVVRLALEGNPEPNGTVT